MTLKVGVLLKTYEEKHSTKTYEPAEKNVAKWVNLITYFMISFRDFLTMKTGFTGT